MALTGEEVAFLLNGDEAVGEVFAIEGMERVYVWLKKKDEKTVARLGCLLRAGAPNALVDVEFCHDEIAPYRVAFLRERGRRIVLTSAAQITAEQMLALRRSRAKDEEALRRNHTKEEEERRAQTRREEARTRLATLLQRCPPFLRELHPRLEESARPVLDNLSSSTESLRQAADVLSWRVRWIAQDQRELRTRQCPCREDRARPFPGARDARHRLPARALPIYEMLALRQDDIVTAFGESALAGLWEFTPDDKWARLTRTFWGRRKGFHLGVQLDRTVGTEKAEWSKWRIRCGGTRDSLQTVCKNRFGCWSVPPTYLVALRRFEIEARLLDLPCDARLFLGIGALALSVDAVDGALVEGVDLVVRLASVLERLPGLSAISFDPSPRWGANEELLFEPGRVYWPEYKG